MAGWDAGQDSEPSFPFDSVSLDGEPIFPDIDGEAKLALRGYSERKGEPMSDPIPPTSTYKSPAAALGQLLLIVLFLLAGGWAIRYYVISPDGTHRATNAAAGALSSSTRVRSIVPTNAIARTVDLLKGLDLDTATVYGKWETKDGAVVSNTDAGARFDLGYHPPGEYDLRFSFARLSGTDGIDTILCYGGRQFLWTMAGWSAPTGRGRPLHACVRVCS